MIELIIIGVVIVIAMQQNKGNDAVQRNQDNTAMQTVKPIGLIWRILLFVIVTPITMIIVGFCFCIGSIFFNLPDGSFLIIELAIPCLMLYATICIGSGKKMGNPKANFLIPEGVPLITTKQTRENQLHNIEKFFVENKQNNPSYETIELMKNLESVDISNIESVVFTGSSGTLFSSETENIKRLTLYITNKLQKTHFAPEELRKVYNHVHQHIASHLTPVELDIVSKKIEQFIQEGGEVKIVTRNTLL